MKIQYFTCNDINKRTANSIQIKKNCEAFARAGTPTALWYNTNGNDVVDENREVYSVRKIPAAPLLKFIFNGVIASFFFAKNKNKKNSIIYTRNFYFAAIASMFFENIVVFEAHQLAYSPQYHTLAFRLLLKWFNNRDNIKVITISDSLKKKFKKIGYSKDMLVAHDGYDPSKRHRLKYPICSRIENKRKNFKCTALYSGSFSLSKGLGYLKHLALTHKDTLFIFAGDESSSDSPAILKCMKRLENTLFLGYLNHDQIIGLQQKADILLLLPHKNGLYNDYTSPMKLFEYMSTGKAVLASKTPSIEEVIFDRKNGIIAEQSLEDIVQKFEAMKNDQELLISLGYQAKRDALQYTWDNRIKKILGFISN